MRKRQVKGWVSFLDETAKMRWCILIVAILLLSFPLYSAQELYKEEKRYINVAVYPSIVPAIKVLEYSLKYGWEVDGIYYQFNVSEINMKEAEGRGRNPLNTANYDVLVIGASARQYFHGINTRWKENVRKFVASGGGYVGVCGGANEASLGYEHPKTFFDHVINVGVLGIANVYINDDQNEEWQYLYKSAGLEGGVPVACELTKHPIVAVSPDNPRIIRYEGGPGMYEGDGNDDLFGEITPIAFYAEEISEKAPIHFWKKINGEWKIVGDVKTDLKGLYAAIATTYGNGRVVLFGPHPEEKTVIGGHVEEFLGRNKYTLYRQDYLYRWVNGTPMNWSYNWWILRRSVAWAAGVSEGHLPPVDESMLFITQPNIWHPGIYLNGRKVLPASVNVFVGRAKISVYCNFDGKVEFYIDGEKIFEDSSQPYEWGGNIEKGWHEVEVKARNGDITVYGNMMVYSV